MTRNVYYCLTVPAKTLSGENSYFQRNENDGREGDHSFLQSYFIVQHQHILGTE